MNEQTSGVGYYLLRHWAKLPGEVPEKTATGRGAQTQLLKIVAEVLHEAGDRTLVDGKPVLDTSVVDTNVFGHELLADPPFSNVQDAALASNAIHDRWQNALGEMPDTVSLHVDTYKPGIDQHLAIRAVA